MSTLSPFYRIQGPRTYNRVALKRFTPLKRCFCSSQQFRDDYVSRPVGLEKGIHHVDNGKVELRPLSNLPTSTLLRSWLLGYCFTSLRLLSLSMMTMKFIVQSKSPVFNADKNPLLRFLLRGIVYDHFCAGTTPNEVRKSVAKIKEMGFAGVILGFSREIVIEEDKESEFAQSKHEQTVEDKCISEWLQANLDTLSLIGEGDYMNIKFTGAGPTISQALMEGKPMPQSFEKALDTICEQTKRQGSRVWIDAEQQVFQNTIDDWAIGLMRRYNKDGKALVFNTVQSYLKASRDVILKHLKAAHDEGWTLGIKLVRGAYLTSDVRSAIWDTKGETDRSYNTIVRDILTKNFGPFKDNFPDVHLFCAGHNKESIRAATGLIHKLMLRGERMNPVGFGQLQGMADEVSGELVQLYQSAQKQEEFPETDKQVHLQTATRPFKCLAWGSVQDCMHFLMRRAVENSSATERLKDGLHEVKAELKRRLVPFSR